MRKGFDTLSALIREHLNRDPTSGDLYLFVSRNRIRAKVILWDGTGACLYSKRLEEGRFACLWRGESRVELELSASELSLFLEGCQEVGRRRLSPPKIAPNRTLIACTK
jgi:transposase